MSNLDSIFKSRGITLPTKVWLVKAMVFPVDNLGTKWFILGHKMINLNLEEGQITIQIVSFTYIKGTISEYNLLVCQVGSEPRGGTELMTEFGVNA